MLAFQCDYNRGAHEKILKRMMELNQEAYVGYSEDEICNKATEKIKQECGIEDAEVYFLVGGTQTNQLVIDTMLAPYEGVLSAATGHVNVHEAGAIEYTGHKVLTLPSYEGKVKASDVKQFCDVFYGDASHEHMVFPGMLYISFPTEYGTLYSKKELEELSNVCQEYNLPLYLDGARLGYGLTSSACDVTMQDIARLCDVFYIGGTKVGALFGEAVVFTKKNMPKHFNTQVKQHGAMLAKGWLLGLQFDVLFEDGLYYEIGKSANAYADRIREILAAKGYQLFLPTKTNQIFVILEDSKLEEMKKEVIVSFWEKYDETHTVVRFATSFATTASEVDRLEDLL